MSIRQVESRGMSSPRAGAAGSSLARGGASFPVVSPVATSAPRGERGQLLDGVILSAGASIALALITVVILLLAEAGGP